MLVKIQRNQIHHFKEQILDAEDNPTGEEKDVLSMNIQFPELSAQYVFGIRIDFPVTKQKLVDAIREKIQEAQNRYSRDENIRQKFDEVMGTSGDVYEFDITV